MFVSACICAVIQHIHVYIYDIGETPCRLLTTG